MAININELYKILDTMPTEQNLMLVGKHGIGKSEILTRYFENKNIKVNTLFLGQMSDPGDIIGLPRYDEKSNITVFVPPYWFPTDGQPIVLFLDELNRARPEILQTVMDLALNRKLAGRELPHGSRLIAAVNIGDEYQLTDLDPALVSRFNIYAFRPSTQEWLLWAENCNVDYRVVDFIRHNPKLLDGDGNTNIQDIGLEKTPDRRAWKKVSDCIRNTQNLSEIHKKLLVGIVGATATQAFFTFLTSQRVISGEDILLNFEKQKSTIKKYRLHELAMVNDSIFNYLETHSIDNEKEKIVSQNLGSYIKFLEKNDKNESLAHFASFFEKDTYPKAISFIINKASSIYESIIRFIENI